MARYNIGSTPHTINHPYKRFDAWSEITLEDTELPSWEWIPLDDAADKAIAVAIRVHDYKSKMRPMKTKEVNDGPGGYCFRKAGVEEPVDFPDDEFIEKTFWDKPVPDREAKRIKKLLDQRKEALGREVQKPVGTTEAEVAAMVARIMAQKANASAPQPTTNYEIQGKRPKRPADGEPA